MVEDSNTTKKRILEIINRKGPSLPVHIAKEISMPPLFVSAYLSQLAGEGSLKISRMKVGNSPLYFLKGQEKLLGNFIQYLAPKEREAQQLLEQQKIISDEEQEPAIRVALRSLKDFATPFEKNNKIYWKYIGVQENFNQEKLPENQIESEQKQELKSEEEEEEEELTPKNNQDSMLKIKQQAENQIESEQKQELKSEEVSTPQNNQEKNIQDNLPERRLQDIQKKQEPEKQIKKSEDTNKSEKEPKKEKQLKPVLKQNKKQEKSEFVQKVLCYLKNKNIEIIQEIDIKKKEYTAIIKTNSDLGKISFYLYAKDKKKISTDDLIGVIKKAQEKKLIGIFLCSGEMSKKTKEYLNDNEDLIKVKSLK